MQNVLEISCRNSFFVFASIVLTIIHASMSKDNFDKWGWRIPFLLGVLVLVFGMRMRRLLKETPIFKNYDNFENDNASKEFNPTKRALKQNKLEIIVIAIHNAYGAMIYSSLFVWMPVYLSR